MQYRNRDLVKAALLSAVAIVLHIAEGFLPAPFPVPGIKLGIANAVTVFTVFYIGKRCAWAVNLTRIFVGSLLSGQAVSFIYSLSGGVLSLIALTLFSFKKCPMWATSIFCAIFHSVGQIAAACVVLGSPAVVSYLPYLVIASIVSGALTGGCSQTVYNRIKGVENGKNR